MLACRDYFNRVNLGNACMPAMGRHIPNASLADLYDPLTMPKPLLDAHRALDRAVDKCYRSAPFPNELARLQCLFELYRRYTEPLLKDQKPPKAATRSKRSR